MIVLVNCVKQYDETKGLSFQNYCDLSIKNKIKNLLRDDRKYFYNVLIEDQDIIELIDYNNREYYHDDRILELSESLDPMLSEYERMIDSFCKKGISSKDIAILTNTNIRQVYNAIQRINRKRRELKNNSPRLELTEKEALNVIKGIKLSSMEKKAYLLYLQGSKSSDIAKMLGLSINQVYDAIRRVNKKLTKNKQK